MCVYFVLDLICVLFLFVHLAHLVTPLIEDGSLSM